MVIAVGVKETRLEAMKRVREVEGGKARRGGGLAPEDISFWDSLLSSRTRKLASGGRLGDC